LTACGNGSAEIAFSILQKHSFFPKNKPSTNHYTMKNHFHFLLLGALCLNLTTYAQPGPPSGPQLGGAMDKLFGENQAFAATLELQTTDTSGKTIIMPGKISFDAGKSRFEVNMTDVQGSQMPPDAAAQMKSMGLDQMVMLVRPDKKAAYLVYPGLQSYVLNNLSETESVATNNDNKVETTELGKETVDGHPCVKNKAVITDKDGSKQESTVWNATDLKNFPVKIQTIEQGNNVTMLFKNISVAKPAASLFEPPSGYTKYDSVQSMMMQQMMKRMVGSPLPKQ
jgi:hypothetical protein